MSTKIYHVSDTHLGKTQYSSEIREEDYAKAFDSVIEDAIDDDADVVIHTGDLFDDRTPSTKSVTSALQTIKKLDDAGIPFLGIVGNHERKWNSQWLDLYESLDNVKRLDSDPYTVNDEVAIYGYDSIRDTQWESMDFELNNYNNDMINVVCMHELFVELMSPMKTDRKAEEVISRLNFKPDLMPLGDYHAAEETEIDGVSVFYAGATERTSATQRDPTYRKIIIENGVVEKNSWVKVSGDLIPRPFYVVNIDMTDSTGITYIRQRVEENVPDSEIGESVVVVKLTGSRSAPVKPADVYELLESINVKIPYVNDARDLQISDVNDEVDASDPTTINIDKMIDEEIDDEISNNVQDIDKDIVRDKTVAKSNIRDIISDQFNVRGDKNEN